MSASSIEPFTLKNLNFAAAEHGLIEEALRRAGSIVGAADLLGLTRHAVKRRIIKCGIRWSRVSGKLVVEPSDGAASAL